MTNEVIGTVHAGLHEFIDSDIDSLQALVTQMQSNDEVTDKELDIILSRKK
jgi:hypothetical protein